MRGPQDLSSSPTWWCSHRAPRGTRNKEAQNWSLSIIICCCREKKKIESWWVVIIVVIEKRRKEGLIRASTHKRRLLSRRIESCSNRILRTNQYCVREDGGCRSSFRLTTAFVASSSSLKTSGWMIPIIGWCIVWIRSLLWRRPKNEWFLLFFSGKSQLGERRWQRLDRNTTFLQRSLVLFLLHSDCIPKRHSFSHMHFFLLFLILSGELFRRPDAVHHGLEAQHP